MHFACTILHVQLSMLKVFHCDEMCTYELLLKAVSLTESKEHFFISG